MKKILLTILLAFALSGIFTLPAIAAVGIPDYLTPQNTPLKNLNEQILKKAKENGPEATAVGINVFLQYIANGLLYVAAPLSIMFVAHAGQNYGFAFGEQSKIEAAKRELTWALLGLVTIIFAYIIVRIIIGAFLAVPTN